MTTIPSNKASVAVLGTLAEFHREPIPYDLPALVQLVTAINPDLLCLDITPARWQTQEFNDLPPEVGEALVPLAYQTDIVVAPIAGDVLPPRPQSSGWREQAIRFLRGRLTAIQRNAATPDAINTGWRHHIANIYYDLTRWLAGQNVQKAYHEHTDHLTQAVLDVARRNPGNRILVVVNVQHCHHIRARLQNHPEVVVTTYHDL